MFYFWQHASDPDATISGYLHKWHKDKKWKKFWFLMKNNVLYTFKASEVNKPRGRDWGLSNSPPPPNTTLGSLI